MISKLKKTRLLKGKSQYHLEQMTGIHQSRISLIESGYRNPTQEQKNKLAKALGINEKRLFSDDEKS